MKVFTCLYTFTPLDCKLKVRDIFPFFLNLDYICPSDSRLVHGKEQMLNKYLPHKKYIDLELSGKEYRMKR